jgi:porin
MLIAVLPFWVVGLCNAEETLKEKLAKLDAESNTQQPESKSTFEEKFDASSFTKRFGLLETQMKTLEEAGKSRDSRISGLEAQQKTIQEVREARDLQISELERKLQAIENRVKTTTSNETLLDRIAELENRFEALDDRSASSQTIETSALLTVPSNFVANVQVPVSDSAKSGVETQQAGSPMILSAPSIADPDDIWQRETLTNGFGGLSDTLADSGIEVGFSLTNIYQANVRGGTTTNHKQGRHTGSYDLEIGADLQQLLGIEGGSLLVHTEGCWSRTDVDETSVGSVFGINADAGGRRAMDVTELWYEQAMFDDTLRLRFGKMDIGGGFECRGCPVSFDGSAYANDETSQFLNGALVNNPTIPMPDMGLGAVLYWNPIEWWYASIGAIDAQADARESGFRTAFHGEDNFFYAAETGVAPVLDSGKGPMPGAYRIGIWNDPQAKERFSDGEMQRDDTGLYISADQMVYKENNGAEDSQGLGVFTRYGMADKKVNDIADFWSFGMQYQGLLEGRDDDVLGLGYAKGIFSTEAGYSEVYESVIELYYSAQIAPWVAISPSVQFVDNPGGDNTVDDSIVFGLRAQSSF